jgi:hypothetical protein
MTPSQQALAPRLTTTLDTVQEILGTLIARYRTDEVLTSVRQIPAREAKAFMVARSMRFLVTTIWSSTSMNTSPPPASREIRTRLCSRQRPAKPARSPARPCGSRTPTG